MAARADDEGRLEAAMLGLHGHRVAALLDPRHPVAPAHVRARRRRALEQIVVELATDDAVARGAPPRRVVPRALELEHTEVERLDGQRVLVRIDVEVTKRLVGDPARADLHPREDGGIEDKRAQAALREPPGGRAAARPAAHHDHVECVAAPLVVHL